MAAGRDYYSILGVPKGCADEDRLRKAYRKLAMQWHPDKNANNKDVATAKFQEISEAYDVLSDPKKKQVYDLYGEDGLKSSAPPTGPTGGPTGSHTFSFSSGGPGASYQFSQQDAEAIFSRMFSGGGGGFGGMGKMGNIGSMHHMNGMGGMGNMGNMFFEQDYDDDVYMMDAPGCRQQQRNTEACYTLDCTLEELCKGATRKLRITRTVEAQRHAATPESTVLEVAVQPGWKQGTKVRFAGAGDRRIGRAPQDIVIEIRQRDHPIFTRHGDDLACTITATLAEALLGFTASIPSIDGKEVKHVFKEVVQPGTTVSLGGHGMPRKAGGRGSMVVTVNVRLPGSVPRKKREQLASLLSN